jgi:hypothetical protein
MDECITCEEADDIEATCEHIIHGISGVELKTLLLPPVALHVASAIRRHEALAESRPAEHAEENEDDESFHDGSVMPAGAFRAAFSVWHAIVVVFPDHHRDADCTFLASRIFGTALLNQSAPPFSELESNARRAVNFVVRCRCVAAGLEAPRTVHEPVVAWVEALLLAKAVPDALRVLALVLALLLGASDVMNDSICRVPRSELVQVFLRGLNLFGLCDALVTTTLLSMVTGHREKPDDTPLGTLSEHLIRASDFYRVDLDVLVDMLRTIDLNLFSRQIISADRLADGSREYRGLLTQLQAVRVAEAQLMADAAPGEDGSVEDVCTWLAMLKLSRDYTERLRFEGVDGAVLWSDLTPSDMVEMGVDAQPDVERVLAVLRWRRK